MNYEVSKIVPDSHFYVNGVSYIGNPISNTAMFITKKTEYLLRTLENVSQCLIFAETGIEVSNKFINKHAFHFSNKPQLAYAKFANKFAEKRFLKEKQYKIFLASGGYYYCEDSIISKDAYIEPGCFIGTDVQIGKNARILAGTVIRHTTIGENFLSNEYAIIGANGFTMTEDDEGNKFRIPTLGRVIIGNNVEVGTHDNISCGSGSNTIIEDYVKLDALVHIGHDVHLYKNVEITAGGIIGGFDDLHEHSYIGINAVLRNRITIGNNAIIGMGSTVTKSVESNTIVAGNPAKQFLKGK